MAWHATQSSLFRFSFHNWYGFRRALLRAFGANVGERARVSRKTKITCPWNLTLRANSNVGAGAHLYALGPVDIGEWSTVSQGAHLCAGTHDYREADFPLKRVPVTVEREAWVCADAFVGPNVTIGEGAILGARSCAMSDLKAWTVYHGNPATPVKRRAQTQSVHSDHKRKKAPSQAAPRLDFYSHFMRPDQIGSAIQWSDLCEGLAARGWSVRAFASNRSFDDPRARLPSVDHGGSVALHRIWRPPLPQSKPIGRLGNAAWMHGAWIARAGIEWLRDSYDHGVGGRTTLPPQPSSRPGGLVEPASTPDVVLLTSDPLFSVGLAPIFRKLFPSAAIAHWPFDLYPEAAAADELVFTDDPIYRIAKATVAHGYRSCDLIADLGPCMRRRIQTYGPSAISTTLTPWALTEPSALPTPNPTTRQELFGDASLALLYSGTFGRAHTASLSLEVMRRLRSSSVHMTWAVRGNGLDRLRALISEDDTNVSLAAPCDRETLSDRLASADVHVVTMRDTWTGISVPSKFTGALAVGRPVLFEGPADASVAEWIREHNVGWTLSSQRDVDPIAQELLSLSTDIHKARALQERAFDVYRTHFSKQVALDNFDRQLRTLIGASPACATNGVSSGASGWLTSASRVYA
ncbi:MAG: hypothetical protein AAF658_10360, partial [Myxococcota bacterium]